MAIIREESPTLRSLSDNIGVVLEGENTPSFASTFEEGVGSALSGGEIIGNTTVQDGYLQSSNFVSGSTGWQLTPLSGELLIPISFSTLIGGTLTSQSIVLAVDGSGDVEIRSGIATGDFANAGAASGFIIGIDDLMLKKIFWSRRKIPFRSDIASIEVIGG